MILNRLQVTFILIVISLLLSFIEILAKTTGSILFPQIVFNSSMSCQRADTHTQCLPTLRATRSATAALVSRQCEKKV